MGQVFLLSLSSAVNPTHVARIDKLNYPTAETVLLVVGFNLVMLALLEMPLLGLAIAPDLTVRTIGRGKAWIGQHGRRFAMIALAALGGLLVIKGLIELVA